MHCLNCGKDIDRVNTKRCVECSKIRRTIRMRDACKRYREKKKVLMTCWTCGAEFRGSGNKDWCSSECIDGPEKPVVKTWPCEICGSRTTNRLRCEDCRRTNADTESLTRHWA